MSVFCRPAGREIPGPLCEDHACAFLAGGRRDTALCHGEACMNWRPIWEEAPSAAVMQPPPMRPTAPAPAAPQPQAKPERQPAQPRLSIEAAQRRVARLFARLFGGGR